MLNENGDGTLDLTLDLLDTFTYTRNASGEIAPFNTDLAVELTSINESQDNISASGTVIATPTAIPIRYGRLFAQHAFGPETQTLIMPLEAQYFGSGGTYVTHTDDGCTALSVTTSPDSSPSGSHMNIPVGSGTSDLSFNTPLISGDGGVSLTPPGSGNTGTVTVTVDLTGFPWLQYDYDGDTTPDSVLTPTMIFGQYRGHDRLIHWLERF